MFSNQKTDSWSRLGLRHDAAETHTGCFVGSRVFMQVFRCLTGLVMKFCQETLLPSETFLQMTRACTPAGWRWFTTTRSTTLAGPGNFECYVRSQPPTLHSHTSAIVMVYFYTLCTQHSMYTTHTQLLKHKTGQCCTDHTTQNKTCL